MPRHPLSLLLYRYAEILVSIDLQKWIWVSFISKIKRNCSPFCSLYTGYMVWIWLQDSSTPSPVWQQSVYDGLSPSVREENNATPSSFLVAWVHNNYTRSSDIFLQSIVAQQQPSLHDKPFKVRVYDRGFGCWSVVCFGFWSRITCLPKLQCSSTYKSERRLKYPRLM
jgi:hypothetical protein